MKDVAFTLEKKDWTEEDFEKMGWHDSRIYFIAFKEDNKLEFDIDYIFKWIAPKDEQDNYLFWVAPCSLIFDNVYNLKIDIEISEPFELEISDIYRDNPKKPKNADFIKKNIEYSWKIETPQGDITFVSSGYQQIVRKEPSLSDKQYLKTIDRG